MSRVLVIIPARGGSKGVRRKNIRNVDGLPLISYSIATAKNSTLTDSYFVDTEDSEIADVAQSYGAPVLIRPSSLAEDDSSVVQVVIRVVDLLMVRGEFYDIVVLLQPTSPIRTSENLDDVIRILRDSPQLEAVISVVSCEDNHPARMYTLDQSNRMTPLDSDLETKRRQELDPVYLRNGCFYAIRTSVLFEQRTFMPSKKGAYVMPTKWLANIDDERDLIVTEALLKEWKAGRL